LSEQMNNSAIKVAKGVRETVNQDGAVLLDIEQGLCFSLNPVGTRIWEMIKDGRSVDEIADALEEEFRFDTFWQTNNSGITEEDYGGAKGLELIPAERVEVIFVAPPAYLVHNNLAVQDGFGDWGFLLKYRILSSNEEHGKYILTAFFFHRNNHNGIFSVRFPF